MSTDDDDYPKVSVNVEETLLDDCPVCQTIKKIKEDGRLRCWNEWLMKRKQVHERLEKRIKRKPNELLMNAFEDIKTVSEEKSVFDHANIPEIISQRGCPGFWKLPVSLREPCDMPKYFSVPTKRDVCKIPDIEYVKTPDRIKEEKEATSIRNIISMWQASKYRNEKLIASEYDIKRVEPYKPQLSDIMISGRSYAKHEHLPEGEAEFVKEENVNVAQERPAISPVFSVNGYNIYSFDSGRKEIRLSYDYDYDAAKVCTNYLRLTNKGKLAIRVTWKRMKRHQLFADIVGEKLQESMFAFDKNLVVIVPRQTFEYSIHFKPPRTGRFQEDWLMIFNPPVGANLEIVLQLVGISYDPYAHDKCRAIEEKLNEQLKKSVIKETINSAIDYVINLPRQVTYTYDEAQLFEAINSNFDPVQRTSQVVYDKEVVDELKQFYERVRLAYHPKRWNLNIEYLHHVTEEREAYESGKAYKEYLKPHEETEELPQPESEHETLLVPCEPTDDSEEETKKGKGKKDKKGKAKGEKGKDKAKNEKAKKESKKKPEKKGKKAKEPEPEEATIEPELVVQEEEEVTSSIGKYRLELRDIVRKLRRTLNKRNDIQEKYVLVYSILLRGIDHLCHLLDDFHSANDMKPRSNYPIVKESRHLNAETFESFHVASKPWPAFNFPMNFKDRPPPEILKDIPFDDCERRHKAYFNVPDKNEKSKDGKNKKGKKDKADKKQKGEKTPGKKDKKEGKKGGKKGNAEPVKPVEVAKDDEWKDVDLDFDPYKEIELPSLKRASDLPVETSNEFVIPSDSERPINYSLTLYMLFHKVLSDIVSDVADALSRYASKKAIGPAVINKLELPSQFYATNSATVPLNVDRIVGLLIKEEQCDDDVKHALIKNAQKYLGIDVKTARPAPNPLIKPRSSFASLSKCLRAYEKPEAPISEKITHKTKRCHVPSEWKRERATLSYEPAPEPFSKEIEVQAGEGIVGTRRTMEDVALRPEDDVVQVQPSSSDSSDRRPLSCILEKCSQHVTDDAVGSKMQLIERALANLMMEASRRNVDVPVTEEVAFEVCETMARRGLVDFRTGDSGNGKEEYVEIDKRCDVMFYDSNDDDG